MKVIKDIRLFKSTEENVDGYSPQAFEEKSLLIVLHRVVMKLREQSFSLGDFDHLYINFTTCLAPEDIQPANRSIDRETRWFRYYAAGSGEMPANPRITARIRAFFFMGLNNSWFPGIINMKYVCGMRIGRANNGVKQVVS